MVNRKIRKGFADAFKEAGADQVAKDIRMARTKQEVIRNVDFGTRMIEGTTRDKALGKRFRRKANVLKKFL